MKLFNFALIIFALFIFSACSQSTPAKVVVTPTVTPNITSTDDQMLKDLESDPDFKIDSTLDNLNSELQ